MNEAKKIYTAIFKKDIPDIIQKRFYFASKELKQKYSQADIEQYSNIMKSISDIESIEYVGRILGKYPILILNFKIMVALGENLPENRNYFINNKNNSFKSLFIICLSGIRSVLKFIKGIILTIFI